MKGLKKNGAERPLFWEARQVPFLRFIIFYAGGILSARWLEPTPFLNRLLWVLAAICLLAFFASLLVDKRVARRTTALPSLLFYFFLYTLGWGLQWRPHPVLNQAHFSQFESEYLLGYIDDEVRPTATGLRFPLQVSHVLGKDGMRRATGRVMVSVRQGNTPRSEPAYGDELLIPAAYRLVSPPYNPYEFDYQSYLMNQGVWHSVYLADSLIRSTGSKSGNWLKQEALVLRANWVQKLREAISGDENFAVASALVLGYRGVLDPDTLQRFSRTGTIHILSVSGLHVGIVFAVFSFLLRWMKGSYLSIARALLLIAAVWMYALLTGFSPSVLRAAMMISFGILAMNLYRRANIFNTTCASAMLLMLYNPSFLFDVGFVLSYLAVLGIISLHPLISSWFSPGRWLSPLVSSASISLAAQWATFPFVFYYFHFFPVYFLPANLLVIFPATLVVYLSGLVLLLPAGKLQLLTGQMLELVMGQMNRLLRFFEELPYATLDAIHVSAFENLLLYALILSMYLLILTRSKAFVSLLVLIGLLGALYRSSKELSSLNRPELVLYNVNRDFAMAFFHGGTASVYSNLRADDRSLQYSVLPSVEAKAKSFSGLIGENESSRGSHFLIQSGLIQFGERRIFLYTSDRRFSGQIEVDILYIRHNAMKDLRAAAQHIRFKILVLDGSNYDDYIERIREEAENLGKSVYILKNNFAYVW